MGAYKQIKKPGKQNESAVKAGATAQRTLRRVHLYGKPLFSAVPGWHHDEITEYPLPAEYHDKCPCEMSMVKPGDTVPTPVEGPCCSGFCHAARRNFFRENSIKFKALEIHDPEAKKKDPKAETQIGVMYVRYVPNIFAADPERRHGYGRFAFRHPKAGVSKFVVEIDENHEVGRAVLEGKAVRKAEERYSGAQGNHFGDRFHVRRWDGARKVAAE